MSESDRKLKMEDKYTKSQKNTKKYTEIKDLC